jgi:hypothetical protein
VHLQFALCGQLWRKLGATTISGKDAPMKPAIHPQPPVPPIQLGPVTTYRPLRCPVFGSVALAAAIVGAVVVIGMAVV